MNALNARLYCHAFENSRLDSHNHDSENSGTIAQASNVVMRYKYPQRNYRFSTEYDDV